MLFLIVARKRPHVGAHPRRVINPTYQTNPTDPTHPTDQTDSITSAGIVR
jgi:hypothetical protein